MIWFRVRLELRDVTPTVWREVLLPSDLPLPQVHLLIQAAMGWENDHLHAFARGQEKHWVSRPHWVDEPNPDVLANHAPDLPESDATIATLIAEPGDRATYLYDFGDDWEHLLTLVETLDGGAGDVADRTSPVLTVGGGACPLEDSGGPPGHEELLDAVDRLERGEALGDWLEHKVMWAFGTHDVPAIRRQLTFDLAAHQGVVVAIGRAIPPLSAGWLSSLPQIGVWGQSRCAAWCRRRPWIPPAISPPTTPQPSPRTFGGSSG